MGQPSSAQLTAFNAAMDEATTLLSIARDSGLQRETQARLAELAAEVGSWKAQAIADADEDLANLFLAFECVIAGVTAELQMWLDLKAEQPEAAWNALIDAQSALNDAIRAHPKFHKLADNAERLIAIENLVFPPQSFLSAGIVVRRQECTVCHQAYEDCPHVVGRPYMGEFCRRRLTEFEADHIALVDDPANKRCRVTHFGAEGGMRNKMTWVVEPRSKTPPQPVRDGELAAEAIILTASDLET